MVPATERAGRPSGRTGPPRSSPRRARATRPGSASRRRTNGQGCVCVPRSRRARAAPCGPGTFSPTPPRDPMWSITSRWSIRSPIGWSRSLISPVGGRGNVARSGTASTTGSGCGRGGPAGRTSTARPCLVAGTDGFGFAHGLVYGLHVAWSGNSRYAVERLPSGLCLLRGGELLLPGEIVLGEGESYSTPWVMLAATTCGLDGLAEQWHGYARALPAHPGTPRPVVCNVWEAVYFDHDLDRLTALADRAAEVGVERFVLDDGWFGARRDDSAGLGDWYVSPEVWPDGLGPLVDAGDRERGWSSGSGSSRRWSTRTPIYTGRTPTGSSSIGDRPPDRLRNQLVLDLGRGRSPRLPVRADRRAAERVRHRVREVGPQPGPRRRRLDAAR